jgi:anti-sigma B factor antagonist
MEIRDHSHGDLLIVQVCSSRLDASQAPEFKEEITTRIASGHTKLVLDFSMVDFVDSTGLGALVNCMKRLGKGQLSIVGVKGAVSRLFALTRMDQVFAVYPTMDAALAHKGA